MPNTDAVNALTELRTATDALKGATTETHRRAQHLAGVRARLEAARRALTAQGVEGKNKEERDARLETALERELEAVREAEADLEAARLTLELARLDHQTARYAVRVHAPVTEIG